MLYGCQDKFVFCALFLVSYCTGITRVIPVHHTSVRSARLPYPYPELMCALYTDGEIPGVRNVRSVHGWGNTRGTECVVCTPMGKYPGYVYTLVVLPGREFGYGYHILYRTHTFVSSACKTSIQYPIPVRVWVL